MQLSNYDLVPVAHMADGMRRYIENGIMPGGFLTAILCNDLMGAARKGDVANCRCLSDWATWLYNYAPPTCFGSEERVAAWTSEAIGMARERTEISAK